MPSYAEVLTETWLPAQASKAKWEAAKATAGAQFDALAEERKALDALSLRRQQYADNIRPRESADAFMVAAMQNQATLAGLPKGGGTKKNTPYTDAMKAVDTLSPSGLKANDPVLTTLDQGLSASGSLEQWQTLYNAIKAKIPFKNLVPPAGLKKEKDIKAGSAQAAQLQANKDAAAQDLLDLADNLGARAFEGGKDARAWYEGLDPKRQEALNLYQQALLDDGKVSPDEMGGFSVEEGKAVYGEAASKRAYRRQDRGAYDPGYLELLQRESEVSARVRENENRLQGKTKETLAVELYEGEATQRAQIPPLLRSLEGDMNSLLKGYDSTTTGGIDAYLNSALTGNAAKGYAAAKAMAASGMKAGDIMASLRALSPEDQKRAMAALAVRDAVEAREKIVPPGTPAKQLEAIEKDDRAAALKEVAKVQTKLQRRLAELDQALDAGKAMDFRGILSPEGDRRRVFAQALNPEQEAAQTPVGADGNPEFSTKDLSPGRLQADAAEVERIAAEREAARIERDRLGDTGKDSYDPALNLPPPPTPPLDGERGAAPAGNEDRAARAAYQAEYDLDRQERALNQYRQSRIDPADRPLLREYLMGALAPAPAAPPPAPAPQTIPVEPSPAPAAAPPVAPVRTPVRPPAPRPRAAPAPAQRPTQATRAVNLDEPNPVIRPIQPAKGAALKSVKASDALLDYLGTLDPKSEAYQKGLSQLEALLQSGN